MKRQSSGSFLRELTDILTRVLDEASPSASSERASKQVEKLSLSSQILTELEARFQKCAEFEEPFIAKLQDLGKHLKPEMSPRQIQNLLVPIERALGREMRDSDFLVHERDLQTTTHPRRPLVFVLDHLRSAFNVGSIFRLADGLNIECIYLCGYTPIPPEQDVDALTGKKDGLIRAALGAEKVVPWKQVAKLSDAILNLKAKGYQVYALETSEKAQALFETELPEKLALVVGNERFGLDLESLQAVDALVKLPLHGVKNSLNVGTALTAAAFEWTRQYESHRPLS